MIKQIATWMRGGESAGPGLRGPWRIFWVGLAVRLLVITLGHTYRFRVLQDHFQFGWEVGRIARALATGHGFADPFNGHSGPTAWIAPLYPLLLAGIFKLFGVYTLASGWTILAVNSIFSAAGAPAVYEIAARCFGAAGVRAGVRAPSMALWSGWLWALYPAVIQYPVHWVWDMSIVSWAFAWVLVLALRLRRIGDDPAVPATVKPLHWAAFGALWAVLCLTNATTLLFLPACAGWILTGLRRQDRWAHGLRGAILAGAVFTACVGPWVARNWLVFHAFIPTRGNLGAELYASMQPENNGFPWGATIPIADRDPDFLRYTSIGEPAYVRERGQMAAALRRSHPQRFWGWALKRVYFFWVSVPHPVEKSWLLEFARELNFCFLSLAGLGGLALALRRRIPGAGLFACAFVLLPVTYYFVTVQARFRHPLEPLICVFGVYLFQSAERVRPVSPSRQLTSPRR